MPALLTKMSRPPNRATVSATHDCCVLGSADVGGPPGHLLGVCAGTHEAVCRLGSRSSAFRDAIMTLAPASAKRAATARPMPRLPPVTSAVLPFSSSSMPRALHGPRIDSGGRPAHSPWP